MIRTTGVPLALEEEEEYITGMKFARRCDLASQNEIVGVRGIPKNKNKKSGRYRHHRSGFFELD
jgi:hypothetical protein